MLIDYISDIHINHWNRLFNKHGGTTTREFFQNHFEFPLDDYPEPMKVAVVAGDNGDGGKYWSIIRGALLEIGYSEVIVIKGNHDFYGEKYDDDTVYTTTIDGVRFACAPLWTNFWSNPLHGWDAQRAISDFHYIKSLTDPRDRDYQNPCRS
jgi:predicted phosphodiesterase